MHSINKLLAAVACALPLAVCAQTATPSSMDNAPSPNVKPADQPRTQLEKDQTTKNGQATKYGAPGTDTGTAADTSQMKMKHKGMKSDMGKSNDTAPGDAPTYPAPAKDGTPTK